MINRPGFQPVSRTCVKGNGIFYCCKTEVSIGLKLCQQTKIKNTYTFVMSLQMLPTETALLLEISRCTRRHNAFSQQSVGYCPVDNLSGLLKYVTKMVTGA